jgi:hypothetical protein
MLAMSPSPSIETLLELKRILDHHYAKLYQAGKLAGKLLVYEALSY